MSLPWTFYPAYILFQIPIKVFCHMAIDPKSSIPHSSTTFLFSFYLLLPPSAAHWHLILPASFLLLSWLLLVAFAHYYLLALNCLFSFLSSFPLVAPFLCCPTTLNPTLAIYNIIPPLQSPLTGAYNQ